MEFEWDEAKRQTNLRNRHLDFADAEIIFSGATFTFEDDRFEYGEDRHYPGFVKWGGHRDRPHGTK